MGKSARAMVELRSPAEQVICLLVFDLASPKGNEAGSSGTSPGCPAPVVFVVTGEAMHPHLHELETLGTQILTDARARSRLVNVARAALHSTYDTVHSPAPNKLRKAGRRVLSARERTFVERLRAGEVLSSDAVARDILGRGSANLGNANAVQKFVSRLRAKLHSLGQLEDSIECVYGGGYRAKRRVARER